MRLSTQPYKGTRDLYKEDFKIQKYIFDTWREVCLKNGFEEYQTPILEPAELYRAKSGEEISGKELFVLNDLKGRELALRPELTPSVTRMVASVYKEWPKPIKLFSIGGFYRQERPQRGRNREFWQLNADIFGETSIYADLEIILLAIQIMLKLNAPENSFTVRLNNRKLLDYVFTEQLKLNQEKRVQLARILDKKCKFSQEEFKETLVELGLSPKQIEILKDFSSGDLIFETEGYKEIKTIMSMLKKLGMDKYVEYYPTLVRGFDYYDGLVFEVYDNNPNNARSLFGGGRYNSLADLFGSENFPAVGIAPGDETLKLFLENWNLVPDFEKISGETKILITATPENEAKIYSYKIAEELLAKGKNIIVDTDPTLSPSPSTTITNALKYANKMKLDYVVIVGKEELENNTVTVKELKSGDQETTTLENFLDRIR